MSLKEWGRRCRRRKYLEVKVFLEAIAMQPALYTVCSFLLLIRGE
jgi:hypothetical protein